MTRHFTRTSGTLLALALSALLSSAPLPLQAQPTAVTTAGLEPMPAELRVLPLRGRRTATAGGQAFCPAGVEPLRAADLRAGRLRDLLDLRGAVAGRGSWRFHAQKLGTIGRIACAHHADPNARPWLTAYRQLMVNALDLDDAGIDALLRASMAQPVQAAGTFSLTCAGLPRVAPNLTPNERAFAELLSNLCTASNRAPSVAETAYWLDAGSGLERHRTPNLLSAMFVYTALSGNRFGRADTLTPEFEIDPTTDAAASAVLFLEDITSMDIPAARRELDVYGLTPDEKAYASAVLSRTGVLATAFRAAYESTVQANESTRTVFLDAPRAAREAFRRETEANRAAVRAAWDVENAYVARDRAHLGSCAPATRRNFLDFVRARSPHTVAEARAVVDSPVGFALATALYRCEAGLDEQPRGGGYAVEQLLERVAIQRGTRVAQYYAAARAASTVHAAQPTVSFSFRVEGLFSSISSDHDWSRSVRSDQHRQVAGVVMSASQVAGALHVVFRQSRFQEPLFQCTATGRIERIERDGTVRYEERCVVVGHRAVDTTPEPIDLPSDMAQGVVPGAYLEASLGAEPAAGYATLVRVAPEGDDVAWFGVSLR